MSSAYSFQWPYKVAVFTLDVQAAQHCLAGSYQVLAVSLFFLLDLKYSQEH